MTKPIIVGYDPRRADHAPLEFGVAAAKLTGASYWASRQAPMAVTPGLPSGRSRIPQGASARTCSRPLDIRVDCLKLRSTSAARALHEAAHSEDAGLLGVAPHAGRARTGAGRLDGRAVASRG